MATAATAVASSVSSAAASGDAAAWARKLALRAAGVQGLAQNAQNAEGAQFGHDAIKAEEVEHAAEEIRYRAEYATINCVDTPGQAFAILLNVMYLAPLTWLFVRFFIRSYSRRARVEGKLGGGGQWSPETVKRSGVDAARNVEKEVLKAMSRDRGSASASAYNSGSNSEVENGGGAGAKKGRKNGLEMTRMEDEKEEKSEEKDEETTEEKTEQTTEETTEETAETNEVAKESKEEDESETKPESTKGEESEPQTKEGEEDNDGKSFAEYAASAGKSDGDDAPKEEGEAEAYEANVGDVMSGEEKEAEKEMQLGTESGVLVDKEEKPDSKE